MQYTISALTENAEGLETIRCSLLRHGVDLRSMSIVGADPGGRRTLDDPPLEVSVMTEDPAEVATIRDALAAGAGAAISVTEHAGSGLRLRATRA